MNLTCFGRKPSGWKDPLPNGKNDCIVNPPGTLEVNIAKKNTHYPGGMSPVDVIILVCTLQFARTPGISTDANADTGCPGNGDPISGCISIFITPMGALGKSFVIIFLSVICFLAVGCSQAAIKPGGVSSGNDKLPSSLKILSVGPTTIPPDNIIEETRQFSQFPETREVIIEFPKTIWIGNSDQVKLTLKVINTETMSAMNSRGIRSLFETHDSYIETRLDVPGLELSPVDPIQEALIESHDNVFIWEVNPKNAGLFRGNLWVFLDLYPKGMDQVEQIPLIIFPIEIRVIRILGITSAAARYLALFGAGLGLFLLFSLWDNKIRRL